MKTANFKVLLSVALGFTALGAKAGLKKAFFDSLGDSSSNFQGFMIMSGIVVFGLVFYLLFNFFQKKNESNQKNNSHQTKTLSRNHHHHRRLVKRTS
ncbi:MAG: hypothetical protein JSU07_03710 [Bacteroidetes bacterium]|nr:hypothetical protein [Bacteroidota bacterium]